MGRAVSLETGLAGRRALVTGGGTGIGRAIAHALAREGVDLAIAGRRPLDGAVGELRGLGVRAHGLRVDVSSETAVVRMVADAHERLGGLDLYVNVAAGTWHQPLTRVTSDAWQLTLDTNVGACVWGCREAARLPQIRGAGFHDLPGDLADRAGRSLTRVPPSRLRTGLRIAQQAWSTWRYEHRLVPA